MKKQQTSFQIYDFLHKGWQSWSTSIISISDLQPNILPMLLDVSIKFLDTTIKWVYGARNNLQVYLKNFCSTQ